MKAIAKILNRYARPEIMIHNDAEPNLVARTALEMAERWGMVAAKPDGEDSVGRQKLAPLTVEELTQRACDTAASLYDEFQKRGWMIPLPSWEEIEAHGKRDK